MYTFEDLKNIMETLRSENGCPWDRVQTHESMKKYLVEECAEVLEAIDHQDTENLCEELGDVLYQIMIHTEIEKEKGNFTIEDVIDGICQKMVRRHPGVFGGQDFPENGDHKMTWEEIKKQEREEKKKAAEKL
ncbi:MAG TPA: nucleotide pyrophosphohydrolase [Candidatus Copromonas faecavium]|uniref:Nucleotide pyrophosphohydrolase n=1 Tax=Candidatus Copromonas faecavium (nom. illeg.) TaxID=2840740 RepID=A0A9D1D505_9FIRM|nr:nucleotide pyrophosphohydrolase [Candidatus Copromonas faecavium]